MAVYRIARTGVTGLSLITLALISYNILKNYTETARHLPIPSEYTEYTKYTEYTDNLPGCLAVINGDLEGAKEFELLSKSSKSTASSTTILPDEDCRAYVTRRGFNTVPLSAEERDFPIAYSMVIHEKVEMFERLLRAIYHPQNVYCVHVDQKSPKDFLQAVSAIVSCFPNVFIASKLESVVYATWSRVQADLNCMKDLLQSPVRWRYLLNTCGADLPIKTNAEMVTALRLLNGRNSMESEATTKRKRRRWKYHYTVKDSIARTRIHKSPPPISSPMYQGNAYFVVTREFVRHVIEDPKIQTFIEWEKDTYSPDEHLWATLQRMPSVPGSQPANKKFDKSDMLAIARLVKWSKLEGNVSQGSPYPPCTGTHRRTVCLFGVGDLRWIFQQHHLMANKFDPEVNNMSITCMETYLYFKAHKDRLIANQGCFASVYHTRDK